MEVTWTEIEEEMEENQEINPENWKKLKELLWKYREVFRIKAGLLTSYVHLLKIKEVVGRSYPVLLAYRDKVEEEINRLLKMDIMQRCSSPYINPIVPVIKKRYVRLCLDATKLKQILLEDKESPEPSDILLQKCKGMSVMSN